MAFVGFVCYCPELQLYQYNLVNDELPESEGRTDYKFDEEELEMAVATHLANNQKDQADFMARTTALARYYPHQFIKFNSKTQDLETVSPKDHFAALSKA
jgi:hypothetical protein